MNRDAQKSLSYSCINPLRVLRSEKCLQPGAAARERPQHMGFSEFNEYLETSEDTFYSNSKSNNTTSNVQHSTYGLWSGAQSQMYRVETYVSHGFMHCGTSSHGVTGASCYNFQLKSLFVKSMLDTLFLAK